MNRSRLAPGTWLFAAGLLLAGCADTGTSGEGGHFVDGAVTAEQSVQADFPPGWDGGSVKVYTLYAHTDTTLYKANPSASPISLAKVGTFDCIGGSGEDTAMTDIAVDKDGNLFGVSAGFVYPLKVSGSTVQCSDKWTLPSGARFYGLTFAPAGVLQSQEMLVAANSAGELWAIDSSGTTTQVGTFGKVPSSDGHGHSYKNAGKAWELSGDIVFMKNNSSPLGFATVRDCPSPPSTTNCNTVDTLVEIKVTALKLGSTSSVTQSVRGQVVKSSSCTDSSTTSGYGSMFGIAAWNDKVYGFSRGGDLVEISNKDGSACLVQAYSSDKFAGAGVTTVVPVQAPD
jgi:hypothetical protein